MAYYWIYANISGTKKWHLVYDKDPGLFFIQEDFEEEEYDIEQYKKDFPDNPVIGPLLPPKAPSPPQEPSILWGEKNQEIMHARTADEAIEEILDACDEHSAPEELTVYEYKQDFIDPEVLAYNTLEAALEWLDENYGDPYGNLTKPTETMKRASLEFAQRILDEFTVWVHCPTGKAVTFNVEDWVKEHCPHWLTVSKE